ncbi:hypothetical protein SAMN05216262_101660 [Colwellia chukchiensis]|uniref:Uncharacterized protein n=1 Tax=Colwellia chukchiensis TaxID=641665 RepID=A0A1H7HZZ8_9GAMM|nr:hypothetical protein [Colwellia chukchiensis]SEK55861.1 hypothetical protein SAMN05216262_101660 [Colwellia chukchiensis]
MQITRNIFKQVFIFIALSLGQFQGLVCAETLAQYLAKNTTALPSTGKGSLNLTHDWGLAAVNYQLNRRQNAHQASSDNNNNQSSTLASIDALFVVTDIKSLQQQINQHFSTGLYSLKNSYILSANHRPFLALGLIPKQELSNDFYQYGRLSTETGYSKGQLGDVSSSTAYIRSSYNLLRAGRFDLSFTASVEGQQNIALAYTPRAPLPAIASANSNRLMTSANLAVVGSYDVTKRWSVISALTVSQLSFSSSESENANRRNMALIATTYAF